MAAKTITVSLPGELHESIRQRVKSGLYADASDVIRAGLHALAREEHGQSARRFDKILAKLPREPITPQTEQRIVQRIREMRAADAP